MGDTAKINVNPFKVLELLGHPVWFIESGYMATVSASFFMGSCKLVWGCGGVQYIKELH